MGNQDLYQPTSLLAGACEFDWEAVSIGGIVRLIGYPRPAAAGTAEQFAVLAPQS